MDDNARKLRDYAFYLLSRKAYSCFEMRRKMKFYVKKRDMDTELIDLTINKLIKLKYLDDKKFAHDYIDSRVRNNPRGKNLIKRELKMKGVEKHLIEEGFEGVEINEDEMAKVLLNKKDRSWQNVPMPKKKERAYRYLTSRGFRMETVYKTVNRCYDLGRF